ncbi:MAG TPA: hypothetical protein VH593_14665 [Ktedonobacteraceae bacterium]|jgi:hypothetical protein
MLEENVRPEENERPEDSVQSKDSVQPKGNMRPNVAFAVLALGYVLGMLGWMWDWQGHLRGIEFIPAHLLMILSAILTLIVIIRWAPPWSRSRSYLLSYVWLIVGVGFVFGSILFAQPAVFPIGGVILLVLPLYVAWTQMRDRHLKLWNIFATEGVAVVLVGYIVDSFWHMLHANARDFNIMLLPGHQIELLGWVVGLLGAAIMLLYSRTRGTRQL